MRLPRIFGSRKGEPPKDDNLQLYRTLIERAVGGVFLAGSDGVIRYASPTTQEILGFTPEELVGRSMFALIHSEDLPRVEAAMAELRRPGGHLAYEYVRATHQDGEWRWLGLAGRNLLDQQHVEAIAINFHDVSTRKQLDELETSQIMLFDKTTGLPNRALLEDRIQRAILGASRAKESLGLLLLNIDRFKDVNDALGHTTGDAVLGMVAERLQSALRVSDTFARLIGDEFVALLRVGDDESALMVADRIEAALEQPFVIDLHPIALSATMGIAFYPAHGENGDELLRHADVALQHARGLHVSVAIYRSDEDEHTVRRLGLRAELRAAIEQDHLIQYYQPKRTLKTGIVGEVEALVRWSHPIHGFVPPSEFIPVAERWDAIKPLTMWALRTGIRQSSEWVRSGHDVGVSVNLSARDLQDRDLPGAVNELLSAHNLPPRLLVVEVTESMLMIDPDRARRVLEQIRSLGIRISIDDFGTGYSSLAYLANLPLDELKIDSSFVKGMRDSEQNGLIVAATIDLGHRLGLTVVAEGVEDAETEKMLGEMSCDLVQGYHVCRPIPGENLTMWLDTVGQSPPR